jgi:hypothetical protein
VRVKFIIGHIPITKGEGPRDGVVFYANSGDDVVDKLIVGERRTNAAMTSLTTFICCMYWTIGIPSLRKD